MTYRTPDLAAECDALRAENARLRAIIDGRDAAPTIREARAHCHGAERGTFVVTLGDTAHGGAHCHARMATGLQRFTEQPQRWIALDRNGRPCPWPVVPTEGSAR